MKLELNREYPEADESEVIDRMVHLARARMAELTDTNGGICRGQHAKSTGCVRALFAVRENLPNYLRHGVFQRPEMVFQAVVRFSNSSALIHDPDGKAAGRGMAIKLLDVDGTQAIQGNDNRCQDFLMFNHPTFPFATPSEYVKFFEIRDKDVGGEHMADALAMAHLVVTHPRHALIARELVHKKVANPLELTYWSGSPYWLGQAGSVLGRTVKYSVVPTLTRTLVPDEPEKMPPDYLSNALRGHLKSREAVFDFRVQLQTDPVKMPVEDLSIEWDETISSPVRVATLKIGIQDIDSPEGIALARRCEMMAFSPWNALAEHRPMGGINRLRKKVYVASQEMRAIQQ